EVGWQVDAAVRHDVAPVVMPVRAVERVALLPGEAVIAEVLDVRHIRQIVARADHLLREEALLHPEGAGWGRMAEDAGRDIEFLHKCRAGLGPELLARAVDEHPLPLGRA